MPAKSKDVVISMQDIVRVYRMGNSVTYALHGISFDVYRGDMMGLIGHSGSGKTTAMHIMGLLDTQTTGEYYLDGTNAKNFSNDQRATLRNEKIGFVFQSFFLLQRLTALENAALPLLYRGDTTGSERFERAEAQLKSVGMGKYLHHRPDELSGGQQQRVAIARALIGDPPVILADEPTGALDSKTSQEVMDLLIDLNTRKKTTIVIVTHDEGVAKQCQRQTAIKDGRIVNMSEAVT